MLTALISFTGFFDGGVSHSRVPLSLYNPVQIETRPWPMRDVGTGGVRSFEVMRSGIGYRPVAVEMPSPVVPVPNAPTVKFMHDVKAGFGRTMSRLPEIFGVSRQTLYNWVNGETPKNIYHDRLRELAAAASLFRELGFKPSSVMLDKTLVDGKSFIQLLAEGANGRDIAKQMIRVVERGEVSKNKLDDLLSGRRARLRAQDIGGAAFDEGPNIS